MSLKKIRTALTQSLWQNYKQSSAHATSLEQALTQRGETPILDHFAIIDLPSPYSGIPILAEIFTALGYCHRGQGYLPEKQNDFIWLSEEDAHEHKAHEVLPQVVLADFRLHELPKHIRTIIEKYTAHINPANINIIRNLLSQSKKNDLLAHEKLLPVLNIYLNQRDWPLPTQEEIHTVSAFNELLAWVLLFGRRVNHFTISAHLLDTFESLEDFNTFITEDLKLALNTAGGAIKGNAHLGIKQSSTLGKKISMPVANGTVEVPESFIEFVWRYRKDQTPAKAWQSYFTGFIAHNANHVIESLYSDSQETS